MAEDALAVTLARAQFAFTVSFHFLLPAFSIGLASFLAVLEGLWLITRKHVFLSLFRYWLKVFAIAFAMGVVSGIVLSYELGANWSGYADRVGPIIGPLMAYEVMTAFFLEAGFLGVMLFGLGRLATPVHFAATLAVAAGTLMSAFWILSANSWMHTPAGYAINAQGQFTPLDWSRIIFNPSFPFRFLHTVLGAYLTTALAVGAVGAWHLLRDRTHGAARVMFAMAMGMVAVTAPLQILAGDAHGLNTLEHQPAKVMALEGHFESSPNGAPLALFGLPNMETGRLDAAVLIPKASSLILKHDPNAPLAGLHSVPRADWPPAPIIFWSFRIMVGLLADVDPGNGRGVRHGAAQALCIYGQLRTFHSASPLDTLVIAASLAAFVVVYAAVFGIGGFYMIKLVAHAPTLDEPGLQEGVDRPQRTAGITPAPATHPDEMLGSGGEHGV
jgi:cytochrome d ubiquinol oxidase subunit I